MRTFIALSSLLLASVLQVRAADHSPAQTEISDKQVSGDDVASRDQSNFEEHQFAERFNKLVSALRSFSETYNSGHVVDVKRVAAVKKAWHELQKSDWFKAQKQD